MSRVDEPFRPEVNSSDIADKLTFRLAQDTDLDAIVEMMVRRRPEEPLSEIIKTTEKELRTIKSDPKYLLYVAVHESKAIGFSRFYDSEGLPEEKKVYPAPVGWYAMGMHVHNSFRRKGVAKFLAINREEKLRQLGVSEFYSLVDTVNLTSLRMHESFGFEKISEAEGFLHIKFDGGSGILFRKTL